MLVDLKKIFKKKAKFDKKTVMGLLPLLIIAWLGNKIYCAYRFNGLTMEMFTAVNDMFSNPMPSFKAADILAGFITAAAFKLFLYIKKKNKKNYRDKEEYGSARWGTAKDIEPYVDTENPKNNIILTQTECLTMNGRVPNPKYARNKNILVVGGSGSGKTRFFVKPNIMQMHSSYVVTDPKGTIVLECGKMLQTAGYRIKVINTINMDKSMHYNPFAYLHSEEDILNLANTIITNTKGEGDKSGEDFWVKAERLLYVAFIALIYYEFPAEEKHFGTLLWLINQCETREDDETFKNRVDIAFEKLEKKKGEDHFAVRQYKKYKLAAGKTAKSILISCGARLAPFDIEKVRKMMAYDEMELDTLGDPDQKTALFVIVSDTSTTFNFIIAMLYTQLFNLLCTVADDKYGGRLPTHVRCLLDEFANIGQIPNFDKLIATIRSREISASIILQSKSQLKAIYKDNADTIIGNCDTELFLGGKEKSTLKELSEILGKQTIDLFTTSETRGQSQSSGTNYNRTGRELMSQDEIAVMDGGKCIMQIRGTRAFFSDKFDITKHDRYKELSDFDPKNTFDITGYVKSRAKIKKNDEIEIMSRMVF
ncbi:MAG: type IV secretory system conjugative DNA transfer family protein [Ruminococcus flavefaciens]|nr:type IV secretory system conjugative DNA transfer family protein [Ruminococcus flavefaciens]MCM1059253.1 type IV secretory system conjugative DNA transfer family protein [Eubacterium sp.]